MCLKIGHGPSMGVVRFGLWAPATASFPLFWTYSRPHFFGKFFRKQSEGHYSISIVQIIC